MPIIEATKDFVEHMKGELRTKGGKRGRLEKVPIDEYG